MHIIAYLAIKAYFTINAYLFAHNTGKRTSGLAAFDMEVAKVCRTADIDWSGLYSLVRGEHLPPWCRQNSAIK
jgi:hypothetical protein